MKNVVVISSSLRNGSNSEILAKEFVRGALIKHNVEYISLKDINLKFCLGCLSCQRTGKCVINDDVRQYLEKISNADILVFATPIYYYSMSGQLKTFLDRLNPLYVKHNNFKEIYLLASCADDSKLAIDKTIVALSGWIECFDGVELKGNLLATSTTGPNTITEEFKNKAFFLGKSI